MPPRCDNCTAGVFIGEENVGECRHRPPTAMLQPEVKVNQLTKKVLQGWIPVAMFPPVRRDHWCRSKFEARAAVTANLKIPA